MSFIVIQIFEFFYFFRITIFFFAAAVFVTSFVFYLTFCVNFQWQKVITVWIAYQVLVSLEDFQKENRELKSEIEVRYVT